MPTTIRSIRRTLTADDKAVESQILNSWKWGPDEMRHYRIALRLTNAGMAKMLGISAGYYGIIEDGNKPLTDGVKLKVRGMAKKMREAMGTLPDDIELLPDESSAPSIRASAVVGSERWRLQLCPGCNEWKYFVRANQIYCSPKCKAKAFYWRRKHGYQTPVREAGREPEGHPEMDPAEGPGVPDHERDWRGLPRHHPVLLLEQPSHVDQPARGSEDAGQESEQGTATVL